MFVTQYTHRLPADYDHPKARGRTRPLLGRATATVL